MSDIETPVLLSDEEIADFLEQKFKTIVDKGPGWVPDFMSFAVTSSLHDSLQPKYFGDVGDEVAVSGYLQRPLYELMAERLPENWRTVEKLNSLDVRSLLDSVRNAEGFDSAYQEAIENTYQKYEKIVTGILSDTLQDPSLTNPEGMSEDIARATAADLVANSRPTQNSYTDDPFTVWTNIEIQAGQQSGLIPANAPVGPVAPANANASTSTSSSTTFTPNAGAYVARSGAAAAGVNAPSLLTTSIAQLSADEIEMLFNLRSADEAINQYRVLNANVDSLGNVINYIPGRLRVDSGNLFNEEIEITSRSGAAAGNVRRQQLGTRTLDQTLLLPNQMTEQQIKNLTDRMREAGIFEMTNGEPTIIGDPTDPQFKRSWRQLVSLSVQHNRPITEILISSIEARQAYLENERTKFRANLTDPAAIRLQTQALARNILGRSINEIETNQIVDMVHNWQKESQLAQVDPEATGDNIGVDWNARMEEYLRETYPAEAQSTDLANTYQTFKNLVTGTN